MRARVRTHTHTHTHTLPTVVMLIQPHDTQQARTSKCSRHADGETSGRMVLGLLKLPILRTLIKLPLNRHNKMGVLCLLWDFQENLQNSVCDENAFYTTVKKAGEGEKRSAVAARTRLYTSPFRRSAIPKVRHSENLRGPPFRRSAIPKVRYSEMGFLDPLFSVIPESKPNILYIKLKLRISSKWHNNAFLSKIKTAACESV